MSIKFQNHVYLDPSECGSEVGYYITTSDYTDKKTGKTEYSINATVSLADCNRKIDWSFHSEAVDKIDEAIAMLQEFRKKYLTAKKAIDNLNR